MAKIKLHFGATLEKADLYGATLDKHAMICIL